MKILTASLIVSLTVLCSLNTERSGFQTIAKPVDGSTQEAERLWELAIAAKGGRERLYAVQSLLVSSGYRYKSKILGREVKTRFEDFYVFPNKAWQWSDERPTVFGLFVKMRNYDRNLNYLSYPNDPKSPRRLELAPSATSDRDIAKAQLFYLMETRWQKPQPISVERGNLNGKSVDIVHTVVN